MSSLDRTLAGFRVVETVYGDTLQKVAAREMGDAAHWYALASINRLLPPYITDNIAESNARVLLSGTELLVPSRSTTFSGVTERAQVYGQDVVLQAGEVVAVNGDMGTVTGLDNLMQALHHRLDTERGEVLYHGDYGSSAREVIGHGNFLENAVVASGFVRRSLLSDPRVVDVRNTKALVERDTLHITCTVLVSDGKEVPVNYGLSN